MEKKEEQNEVRCRRMWKFSNAPEIINQRRGTDVFFIMLILLYERFLFKSGIILNGCTVAFTMGGNLNGIVLWCRAQENVAPRYIFRVFVFFCRHGLCRELLWS